MIKNDFCIWNILLKIVDDFRALSTFTFKIVNDIKEIHFYMHDFEFMQLNQLNDQKILISDKVANICHK